MSEIKKPDKSGMYVAITEYGYIGNINYSKKHDLWNAYDHNTRKEAIRNAICIALWIEWDKVIEFVEQKGNRNGKI